MTGVVVSCSYSFDSTTDHLHDFVNGTGQDTLLISCQHSTGLRPAGRNWQGGAGPGSSAGQAVRVREGGARGVCRVAGVRPETDPGQASSGRERRERERGRQPDSRQGPATGQGWILT